jgi:hypothetical protein
MAKAKSSLPPQFVTLGHVCSVLGCSYRTGSKMANDPSRDFPRPVFKLGRQRVVSAKQLAKWLAQKHGETKAADAA